jgi:hypothetical protein
LRTNFVTTSIRPFKKIFVVQPDDVAAFDVIRKTLSDEIDQICNLILPLDDIFQLESTREFIRRCDPDILFNLTDEDDAALEERFQVKTVKPDSEVWRLSRFGTNLMSFMAAPTWANKFGATVPTSVFATNRLLSTPESLFSSVNFGYVPDVETLHLGGSIFADVSIVDAPGISELCKDLFNHDKKYCHLTTHIGFGGGGGSSVFEIDYNRERHFQDGVSVFVGRSTNLAFLYYFWNSRAYNPFSNMVWIPAELLNEFQRVISSQENLRFYVADADSRADVEATFDSPSITIVQRYYFSGTKTRWQCFDHSQSIQISGDTCYLQHPREKTFADLGIGAFVIEVQGIQECMYPVRASFWYLYHPKVGHWQLFQERFKRISRRGLAAYFLDISFDNAPIGVEFPLPSYSEVMRHMFLNRGLEIRETPKSRLLSQLVNLLGGLANAGQICKKHVFDLIYSSSPAVKTEVALRKLFPGASGDDHDSRVEAVSRAVENGTIEVSAVFATADDLYSKAKTSDKSLNKAEFFSTLQTLYDNRVFLRGKNFDCPLCASNVWLPLERLSNSNYCPDCGNSINIPVGANGAVDKDKYRLNQLLVRAIDQGQLSTLLLLNLLGRQEFRVFDYMTNVEIIRQGSVVSDADILFRMEKKLGMAECKSARSFPTEQIDAMVDVIRTLGLDFGIFSCLLSADSPDLAASVEYIRAKDLAFPILIVTKEALFSPSQVKLYRYLELSSAERFPVGPVVVKPKLRAPNGN